MVVKNYLKKSWYLIGPILIFIILQSGLRGAEKEALVSEIVATVDQEELAVTEEASETSKSDLDVSEAKNIDHEVVRVIDGDTFEIMMGDDKETVRVIGINTPETVDPRRAVECFGREASEFAKKTLVGQKVSLAIDPTQDERDKYQRLLRYVMLSDGSDYGETMILAGYAYEYTYKIPYQKQSVYKTAQTEAQVSGAGLWSTKTCEGKNKL